MWVQWVQWDQPLMGIFATCAYSLFTLMTLLWLLSLKIKNVSIIDAFWGMGFVVCTGCAYWEIFAQTDIPLHTAHIQMVACVVLWGSRLSWHLSRRAWVESKEDFRYAAMRSKDPSGFPWKSLVTVFYLQAILVLIISLPIILRLAHPTNYTCWDGIGGSLWFIGFWLEWEADRSLRRAKSEGVKLATTGVWSWSRHPNYLGNALLWWGIALMGLSVSGGLLGLFSAYLMTFLLTKVSGVPLLEAKMKKRPGWGEYASRTPVFWPWSKPH